MTLQHIIVTITLSTTVAFVTPLVALLPSSPVMWNNKQLWHFSALQTVHTPFQPCFKQHINFDQFNLKLHTVIMFVTVNIKNIHTKSAGTIHLHTQLLISSSNVLSNTHQNKS
jgi:hypothetical protein